MITAVTGRAGYRVRVEGKFFRLADEKFVVRGVTYGPFAPVGEGTDERERWGRDLGQMAAMGFNVVRVYEAPTREFVGMCREAGMRVLVSVPWAQHVDFFEEAAVREAALAAVRKVVGAHHGSAGVLGYLVGNEIEATLARWMGPQRVRSFLEELIEAGRERDGDALFAYANYPSTEYLSPRNEDFTAFNVFLEDADSLGRYLARLHHVAGDRPLVVSEFGLDARENGEEAQAAAFDWFWREAVGAGLGGGIWFSFTDDWYRGGEEVRDWEFGMTRRGREEKAVCETARGWLGAGGLLDEELRVVEDGPKVSVIVCSHNGGRTLRACLESLGRVRYGNREVIVVDDGSEPELAGLVSDFSGDGVRYIRQGHEGLSQARNRGAMEADGEVLVYTDDDCEVDEDWLGYLVSALEGGEYAAVGGPNIPPGDVGWVERCVGAAPGGPMHVMLTDEEAEHLPGCNLAVRWDAFQRVGGFLREYRAAGDDVDFCWRLQELGMRIGFAPAAMVWHRRRATMGAYLRQQAGYGRAEALLIQRHPDRFGPFGGAQWRGFVYQGVAGLSGMSLAVARIYQGVFGYAPFQRVYGGQWPMVGIFCGGWMWHGVALVMLGAGLVLGMGWLWGLGVVMLALSGIRAWLVARRLAPPGTGWSGRERATLFFLSWAQPLVRGWTRYIGSLGSARGTRAAPDFRHLSWWPRWGLVRMRRRDRFWNRRGVTRDRLLAALPEWVAGLMGGGFVANAGMGWERWDLEISRPGFPWVVRVLTVTEYHEGGDRLTRVKSTAVPTSFLVQVSLLFLAVLVLILVVPPLGISAFLVWVLLALYPVSQFVRGWRLLGRVRESVRMAARECGVEDDRPLEEGKG
ncbi:MAG: glycosyltransferase [Verrucomicrobiota bacterium]